MLVNVPKSEGKLASTGTLFRVVLGLWTVAKKFLNPVSFCQFKDDDITGGSDILISLEYKKCGYKFC